MKDQYEKLQKKYSLPSYKELNVHFELDNIEEEHFLLRSIRRKMHEKLVFFARIFERVLFPNQNSIIEMSETKFFSDKEKDELFKVYEELLELDRRSLFLNVYSTDEQESKFINLLFKKWPVLIKKSQFVIDQLDKYWKDRKSDLTKKHYFG